MNGPNATASPLFEDVRRTAALALTRHEFSSGSTRDEADQPPNWVLSTANVVRSVDSSADAPATRLLDRMIDATQFATLWVSGSVDSSTDAPTRQLVDRIIDATQQTEIIDVLSLLGLRAIADRLKYLHELTADDDPDEPTMALASLRELALFFVSEPQLDLPELDHPEIGIGPDGFLQAEWVPLGGAFVAMKFLPTGSIQFAAISTQTAGDGQRPPVHGTESKDRALDAVRAFIRQGTL